MAAERTAGRRRGVRLVATAVGLLLLLSACSGGSNGSDGGGSEPGDGSPTTSALAGRQVVGEAEVSMGDRSWTVELTSCTSQDGRLTVQGDDQEGTTVVGTFRLDPPTVSFSLMSGDRAWSIGGAGAPEVDDVEVAGDGASGSGTFTFRSLAAPEAGARPVTEEPRTGSFSVTCTS